MALSPLPGISSCAPAATLLGNSCSLIHSPSVGHLSLGPLPSFLLPSISVWQGAGDMGKIHTETEFSCELELQARGGPGWGAWQEELNFSTNFMPWRRRSLKLDGETALREACMWANRVGVDGRGPRGDFKLSLVRGSYHILSLSGGPG